MPRYKTFGTLYENGKPISASQSYTPGADIRIGKTIKQSALRWIIVEGVLIARDVILSGISWVDLQKQGFVDGKSFLFDGVEVVARMPRIGSAPDCPCEWSRLFSIAEKNWTPLCESGRPFWGEEIADKQPECRATICNGHWMPRVSTDRGPDCGWRPILDPANLPLTQDLIGQRIAVWDNDISLSGMLREISSYDLVLDCVKAWPVPDEKTKQFFCTTSNHKFIINRSKITRLHAAFKTDPY